MIRLVIAVFFIGIVFSLSASGQQKDALLQNFLQPPASAKPRVWWHWMNGNITKDGIKKDLLWMNRSDIGGFQNFDAAFQTPQIVKSRLIYMTPEWKDAFRYALHIGDSLKMEMAIASSPGWSETGGSWVPVEDGMKKLVWTETRVKAGQMGVRLPQPPASQGIYQTMPLVDALGLEGMQLPSLYKDVSVIAFPLADKDVVLADLYPVVQSSAGKFTLAQLTDGDLAKADTLPGDPQTGQAWISYGFAAPQTVRAITIMGGGDKGFLDRNGELKKARAFEVSDDGVHFRHVAYLPAGEILQMTYALPPVTGRYFRVTFANLPGNPGTPVAELVLHGSTRVNYAEEKAGFAPAPGLLHVATPENGDGIPLDKVLVLTDKVRSDGTLDWTPPSGNWCVLRLGYTVMAITNHPATKESTGFEVDKMDPDAIKRYFDHYLGMYQGASKEGLKYMVTDSWEAGAQNWTPKMIGEFEKRRGYSMLPWMPALAGYIVKDAASSDKFLYDFRKTIGEMTVSYHYDQLTDVLKGRGMRRYSESHESKRALIADGMEVKRTAAVPMSAIWTKNPIINKNDQTNYMSDIRESASVAHIYGQNLVAAESFTALAYPDCAWSYCPENLKPTADLALACGLNRFVIHCSPHQPVDSLFPGLGLGPFGQWFTRHETWAGQAKAWADYLARSSYLLQQGRFVADIAYYYGEDDNVTSIFRARQPDIPQGYNYDYVNSDILLRLLSAKDGRIITPNHNSYKVLVLDSNARVLPLEVLRKIETLYDAGAMIAGVRPERPADLLDDTAAFKAIVHKIWDSSSKNVHEGFDISKALLGAGVSPDFSYVKVSPETRLLYVHRQAGDEDIYWVNSRNKAAQTVKAVFRVTGRLPEIWHPETGRTEATSYVISGNSTTVELSLSPEDAVFVIFRKKAVKQELTLPQTREQVVKTIGGSWNLSFQKDRGAPAQITLDSLTSWTRYSDKSVNYFSGTGTYTKIFTFNGARGKSIWLDLGSVKNLAEVRLNGKSLGVVWKQPFRVDVSSAIKSGSNALEIKVVNLWVNRLIGDQQPGAKRIAYTTEAYYDAQSPLSPSGLLGPVTIRLVSRK